MKIHWTMTLLTIQIAASAHAAGGTGQNSQKSCPGIGKTQKMIVDAGAVFTDLELQKRTSEDIKLRREIRRDYEARIRPILQRHCFNCHNGNPQAEGIDPQANIWPFKEHRESGLKKLEMEASFPFGPGGISNANQIGLLKKIAASMVSGSKNEMPPSLYRKGHIDMTADEMADVRTWAIYSSGRLVSLEKKRTGKSPAAQMKSVIQQNCATCHNPQNASMQGALAHLDDLGKLRQSQLINLANPGNSEIYKAVSSGAMPGGKPVADVILNWIKSESPSGAGAAK